MPVTADKQYANKSDIIVKDKKTNSCLMIDMTIPSERNVLIKQFGKAIKIKRSQNGSRNNVENKENISYGRRTQPDYKRPWQIYQRNSKTYRCSNDTEDCSPWMCPHY